MMEEKRGISVGAKVYAEIKGQLVPGRIIAHDFASMSVYDLYTLHIAEYDQQTQTWWVSAYGPIQSDRLAQREMYVPALDLDENVRHRTSRVPEWVRRLQD
jgi:hypothetical protein